MVYRSYICEDCGFSSEEEEGVYLCPKCNNKMRIAKVNDAFSGGGDTTQTDGKIFGYIIFTIILLPILFAFLNIFGVIIFIVLFYYFRKSMNNSIRDKAIPVKTETIQSIEDKLYCVNCGQELKANDKFCPNCGEQNKKDNEVN